MSKRLDALEELLSSFPELEAETERERTNLDDLLASDPTPLDKENPRP